MCICVCVCVYIYIYIYIHIHTYVCVYIYIYIYTHRHNHTFHAGIGAWILSVEHDRHVEEAARGPPRQHLEGGVEENRV